MGLIQETISYKDIARTLELRIDAHHYWLRRTVADLFDELPPNTLQPPVVNSVQNGVNLPQKSYDLTGEDSEYLYVSVAGISQFVLRPDRCVSLKSPSQFKYALPLGDLKAKEAELLITRSGTPGITWPSDARQEGQPILIPSGFIIRVQVDREKLNPVYLTSVLNHPAWRVWTSSLAAGKRQRNLSQEHLAQTAVPAASSRVQEAIASDYMQFLSDAERMLEEEVEIASLCDEILSEEVGLKGSLIRLDKLRSDLVSLVDCTTSPILRLDSRYHRGDVRRILAPIAKVECATLKRIVGRDLIKGIQPIILPVDEDPELPRVIATGSIQGGQVVHDLTKPTTEVETSEAGDRLVQANDLLVTMDGEGSIGKAAVFEGDYEAVPDSHVGILRVGQTELALTLGCYLNSSFGQAQFLMATSGATGQTQVSKDDFLDIRVPEIVVQTSPRIAARWRGKLKTFEDPIAKLRKRLCRTAVRTSEELISSGTLTTKAAAFMHRISDEGSLYGLLSMLKPGMF